MIICYKLRNPSRNYGMQTYDLIFTLPEPFPNMTLLECATRLVVGVVNAGKIIV